MTIGQRKTRRQLKMSGEDLEEDQVIQAKPDDQDQIGHSGRIVIATDDADVSVGVKRNHNQTITPQRSGIITIDTGPVPDDANVNNENQNSSNKIQIPMGDIRRSTRNKR